ncbi:MAG: Uma2 family endonuclease [Oscillochloridaceae bacterium umkhey_bin13]
MAIMSPVMHDVVYPDSDGKPMAENTLQFRWIVTIQGGFDALFRDHPEVFVAGDLLWYPVEGRPDIRQASDTLVVFGRPKGYRGSYIQHREAGIAPQVVFEVLSPGNTHREMVRKWGFYDRYGVEEYYVYDPDNGTLDGWVRSNGQFEEITSMEGWVSPRTGVRFGLEGPDLVLTRPDGTRFKSYLELDQERAEAEAARQQAEAARQQAEAHIAQLEAQLRAAGLTPE